MFFNENDANVNSAVPSSGDVEVSQVAEVNADSDSHVTNTSIAHEVPCLSVAEYITRYADTLEARWFGAMFSD